MPIKVTRTGGKLTDIALVNTSVMRAIGGGLLVRIRKRTRKGIDVTGKAFTPLSTAYAEQKRKALGSAKADLEVSGRMLNDMTLKPQPKRVRLFFLSAGSLKASGVTFIQRSRSISAADKAFWHNETGAGRRRVKRVFFDLNNTDITWAQGILDTHIAGAIR